MHRGWHTSPVERSPWRGVCDTVSAIYPGLSVPQGWPRAARSVGAGFAPTGPLRPRRPAAIACRGSLVLSRRCAALDGVFVVADDRSIGRG